MLECQSQLVFHVLLNTESSARLFPGQISLEYAVGDSFDNALAETINGLYKAKLIHKQSWKNREAVLNWPP